MEINNCFISPANNSSNNEENINVLTGLRRRRNNNNNVMNINEKPSLLLSENEGNYEQWPDFGCEGIKVQRAHQPTSQCQGKKKFWGCWAWHVIARNQSRNC
eukprot:TRINITY_DN4171_c0_g1_i1.p2 TRINITY_DN4171_c0_g1~~TRINITY_DN4171_c0_g1_i1.p2  ORF type:complete len:116 (-),score=20.52 TRINITY_DN4171_c0_g1_i1:136-441(-)